MTMTSSGVLGSDAIQNSAFRSPPALHGHEVRLAEGGDMLTTKMLLGIRGIEDSWVYQDIFTKGRAEGSIDEARTILLGLGRKRLGEPDSQVQSRIEAMSQLDRLNHLLDRILDAKTWADLLASLDE
jgi:hypothetical protein